MAKARLGRELAVKTENKVGVLAEVTSLIANAGVNIQAICAYAMEKEAYFMIVTEDNKKAEALLKKAGYEVTESEIILVDLENKPGALEGIASKLKDANIDLNYIYGTTYGKGPELIILNSNNNAGAIKALK